MNSGEEDLRKKVTKKEKEKEKKKKDKGWVKKTKLLQQKVGSVFQGFFGQKKKPKQPVICSSGLAGKCNTVFDGLQNKIGSLESSGKPQPSLSNQAKEDSESRQRVKEGNLTRVSSWRVRTRPKLKIARSMRRRGSIRVMGESESEPLDQGQEEREKDREENELCKKRILMGGKCKPLEFSGVLHGRKDGMFSAR